MKGECMTVLVGENPAEISDQILNFIYENSFDATGSENVKVNSDSLNGLANLIAFLNETNEVTATIDDFNVNNKTISVTALGSFIGFAFKEPLRFAGLISDAVGFSSSTVNVTQNGRKILKAQIEILMPNILVRGDDNE